MITSLYIENFALIDKLEIDFTDGFSTITGETGAGKSILLGALGLALGKRADLSSLKDKERKCIVEASFSIADYNLVNFFKNAGLDYDANTIIRREILPSGKSRAFVNDTPVNLQELQELGEFLIDIHSQHETRELSAESYQFRIIDAVAGNSVEVKIYQNLLKQYKEAKRTLEELHQTLQNLRKEYDYNMFLLEELIAANLADGEIEELEEEVSKLSNVGFLSEQFSRALQLSNNEASGILQNLREFKLSLQKTSSISPEYNLLAERAGSVLVEFDDLISEIEAVSEKLFADPNRLETVNQRLQLLANLLKKHGAANVSELIKIKNSLDEKVISATETESAIEKQTAVIDAIMKDLDDSAAKIHEKRINSIPELSKDILKILATLGMPHARFDIKVSTTDSHFQNGKDELAFLFAANKGSDFGSLKKVASGGEMSRIMLAVKSILAKYSKLPTIIFDEIDTGVSGEIADSMGNIMKEMSQMMQVFAITHLPQIAAKGKAHFRVYKTVSEGKTHSGITRLSADERIDEIARMLSGSAVSESAINHARALLD